MNRREFLQCAALLAAGSQLAPSLALSAEQQAFLAARANYVDTALPDFFTAAQRATVSAAAEQVIPATDTPGAIDAGVPRFIELMVHDWFNDSERALFMAGLAELDERANGNFAGLPPSRQLAILEALEAEAAEAPWFELGNILRVWDSEAPFICQFKELTVLGFMLSETAARQFQRENSMGEFNGHIALASDDPAWAAELPLRAFGSELNP